MVKAKYLSHTGVSLQIGDFSQCPAVFAGSRPHARPTARFDRCNQPDVLLPAQLA